MPIPTLTPVKSLEEALTADAPWDALVWVTPHLEATGHAAVDAAVAPAKAIDAQLGSEAQLLFAPEVPGRRLVVAPTGPLDRDYDDVRRVGDAAKAGLLRAKAAGAVKPLLWVSNVPSTERYTEAQSVAVLQAAGSLWEPLEAREAKGETNVEPVQEIGVVTPDADITRVCSALTAGRRLAQDLCGTEPERMAPAGFVQTCQQAFENTGVELSIIDDRATLDRDYPLLSAVARASYAVPRHQPRVLRLVYQGTGEVKQTLLLAGKGVVYDTGGADLKTNGTMAGMSRDKGGAAGVAGFVLAAAHLKTPGIRIVAELGLVRNSVGVDAFVADEIITGHSGCRVRIGNTDAEGRLVLADLLSHLRTEAQTATEPRIFSVATLTGHSVRAVGNYSITLDNGPARTADISGQVARAGEQWGDPFEISRLRRDDFDFVKPHSKADDVLSCNNAASSATARGHQFPMAFLAIASGLDKHGGDSDAPIAFTHCDIGGGAMEGCNWQHGRPTGTPVVALSAAFLL